jgi:hypothetical protein
VKKDSPAEVLSSLRGQKSHKWLTLQKRGNRLGLRLGWLHGSEAGFLKAGGIALQPRTRMREASGLDFRARSPGTHRPPAKPLSLLFCEQPLAATKAETRHRTILGTCQPVQKREALLPGRPTAL